MPEIINLRLARKAKARRAAETEAAQNRLVFGETKAQKALRKAEAAREKARLEAGRITGATGKGEA